MTVPLFSPCCQLDCRENWVKSEHQVTAAARSDWDRPTSMARIGVGRTTQGCWDEFGRKSYAVTSRCSVSILIFHRTNQSRTKIFAEIPKLPTRKVTNVTAAGPQTWTLAAGEVYACSALLNRLGSIDSYEHAQQLSSHQS